MAQTDDFMVATQTDDSIAEINKTSKKDMSDSESILKKIIEEKIKKDPPNISIKQIENTGITEYEMMFLLVRSNIQLTQEINKLHNELMNINLKLNRFEAVDNELFKKINSMNNKTEKENNIIKTRQHTDNKTNMLKNVNKKSTDLGARLAPHINSNNQNERFKNVNRFNFLNLPENNEMFE